MDEVKDWETSEEYYKQEKGRELSLEDFITGEETMGMSSAMPVPEEGQEKLAKTVRDVKAVMALAAAGRTVEQIAEETGLDRQYVYDIQVCAQGFREDDEIAVAHLLLG